MGTPEDAAAEEYFTRPTEVQPSGFVEYMKDEELRRRAVWALIDNKAELPKNPYTRNLELAIRFRKDNWRAQQYDAKEIISAFSYGGYAQCQQDMKAAGWRKVVAT